MTRNEPESPSIRLKKALWLLVPVLAAALPALWATHLPEAGPSPAALLKPDFLILLLVSLFVAYVCARSLRAQSKLVTALRDSEDLYRRTLNALLAHIAVIDPQGRILAVNQAWSEFGRGNAARGAAAVAVGANYLDACRRAATGHDAVAAEALAGIEAVLQGGRELFTLEYPCHSSTESRWFLMTVVPLAADGKGGAVITHLNITARRLAESELRQSEERLQAVLRSSSVGSFEVDLQTGAGHWNDVEFELLGLQPNAVPGSPETFFRFVHPDDLAMVTAHWQAALKTGALDTEFRIVRADGEERWLAGKGRFVSDLDGQRALRFLGVNFDITARKRSEQALGRLNRTYQALASSGRALIHATDEEAYLQEICQIIVENCGYKMVWVGFAEQDEARSVRPAASAGFAQGYLESLQITWADTERGRGPTGTAIRSGQVCQCRNMLTDPRFEPWREQALQCGFASSAVFPLLADGVAFGALSIYTETPDGMSEDEVKLLTELADDFAYGITALRLRAAHAQAEAALFESETRFRSLFEGSLDAIFALDNTGRLVQANPAATRISGYSAEELTSRSFTELCAPDALPDAQAAFTDALAGRARELELAMTRKDGQRVELLVSGAPMTVSGSVQGVFCVASDITERKRIEEKNQRHLRDLLHANEELARFNRVAVDRELRMIELKKELNALRVGAGLEGRYPLAFEKTEKPS